MKPFVFTLFIVLMGMYLNAQNSLTIFAEDGEKFLLFVNKVKQNDMPAASVTVKDLSIESVKIKLAFNNKGVPELSQTIYFQKPEMAYTFCARKDKKKYKLHFVSEAPIEVETLIEVTDISFGEGRTEHVATTIVTETVTTITGEPVSAGTVRIDFTEGENGLYISENDDKMPESVSFDLNVNESSSKTQTVVTTTTNFNESVTTETYTQEDIKPCTKPVSDTDFIKLRKSIEKCTSEDAKLSIAEQITSGECLISIYVGEIIEIFEFEDTRLIYAQFAYDFVFDPDNYFLVTDGFEFEATAEELIEFIQSK